MLATMSASTARERIASDPVIGTRDTRAAFLAAAAATAVLLTGCLGSDEGTKAGGSAGPLTLRVGTDDPAGRPGEAQIGEFAHQVDELSGGEIRIKAVLDAGGSAPGWDQRVARKVAGGELDMGLIPTRAWDTEGVTTLRALNAPFLITSDELLAEVISGELAGDLMSGLDEAGVVPLALFPEGLRHPFGFDAPLLGPEDYEGQTIRTPTSATTTALFKQLGATTDAEEPRDQAGMESAYFLEPHGTATGNVTFYPKANSLVVGDDAWGDLDDDQRDMLRKAATRTRERLIEAAPRDAQAARAYCADGGAVALASDADVAALEEATAPLYAELERDGQTRRLIEAIRELERTTTVSATAPKACGKPSEATEGTTTSAAVDGVYRFEVTDEQLRDAGVTDPVDIDEEHGLFTITLSRGDYCWEQRAPNPLNNPDDCDTYEIRGHRMTFFLPAIGPDVYRWRKTEGGDLELSVIRTAPGELPFATAWTTPTWTRIGGGVGE